MNVNQREALILLLVFVAVVVFILKYLVADLPDDFLQKARPKRKRAEQPKGGDDGRLRDHW